MLIQEKNSEQKGTYPPERTNSTIIKSYFDIIASIRRELKRNDIVPASVDQSKNAQALLLIIFIFLNPFVFFSELRQED